MNTERIWKEFSGQLLGFIKARINDKTVAEDILQEVFIKIHQNSNQLLDENKLASWIYQVTRNTIIDHYRKKKLPLAEDVIIHQEQNEESGLNPQFIKCMMPFISQLPEKYKDALEKTVYGEISQKEYAENLGLSYTTVKSRVQRGRQKLKELFTQCCAVQSDRYGNIISSNIDNCSC